MRAKLPIIYKFDNEFLTPAPYFCQWVAFCWHKPIYLGLPLVSLVFPFLIIDGILGVISILRNWGGGMDDLS